MGRRFCIDGKQSLTSVQKQVHCLFSGPKFPLTLCVVCSDSWIASTCLSSHLPHIYSIPNINRYTVCLLPAFCNQLANASPSRVQKKTSEMTSSRLVTMNHKESKIKYWYKQKTGKPGKQLPLKYKRMFSNKQIVCIEWRSRRSMSARPFGCVASCPRFYA